MNQEIGKLGKWPIIQLRHQFNIFSGSTPDSSETDYWDGDILWATPEDVGRLAGNRLADTRRKLTVDGYKNCGARLVPVGSIVLTKRAPIGQLAILDKAACCNQGCFLLVPKQKVEPRFYYYLLYSQSDWLHILVSS